MKNSDYFLSEELFKNISKEPHKSFFLFAGAGSGKTFTLVHILKLINDTSGDRLRREQRKVAVITYTNAATDEIKRRLDYNDLFQVSTIHSFIWDVIQPYQVEIKSLYLSYIQKEIDELQKEIDGTSNKSTKKYQNKIDKLNVLQLRLETKGQIDKFVYNPNGDNLESNSLNHSDVIKIGADLILGKELFRKIIAQQYPFMLVDESQDTQKTMVDAFFSIQKDFSDIFTLGFIGDQKQRIYMDGKIGIVNSIPKDWQKPELVTNYRSSKRVIQLANKIASYLDRFAQNPIPTASEGYVRFFLVDNNSDIDKYEKERKACEMMLELTGDEKWNIEKGDVKVLILEHRMAAMRLGFENFHDLFARLPKYQMSYLQGTMPEMTMFSHALFPILECLRDNRRVELLEILKKYSPLLAAVPNTDYVERLHELSEILNTLKSYSLRNVSVAECLAFIREKNFLMIPEILVKAMDTPLENLDDKVLIAWKQALDLPLGELKRYDDYVNERTIFATHQGVKGLEYPRVLVLIDNKETRGNQFNYDKLFEVVPKSATDIKNEEDGKETTLDRTMRLLYVTCTRAKESLAILMYTSNPEKAKQTALKKGWFANNEIIDI